MYPSTEGVKGHRLFTENKLVFPVECPVLLELSESIEFGPFVSPLCLPIFRTFNPNFLIGGSITYWSASGDTKCEYSFVLI
ncbi:hypothetical protein E2C01_029243 [Portunus trituberculatus]|uniref:Uncharacterized protein n=1 Tax=Portunus trituberculatus TaxID=210409 RepID=A0A5B7ERC9_PORTR|nr:hypothetical protein [Portunus trituberculatus]